MMIVRSVRCIPNGVQQLFVFEVGPGLGGQAEAFMGSPNIPVSSEQQDDDLEWLKNSSSAKPSRGVTWDIQIRGQSVRFRTRRSDVQDDGTASAVSISSSQGVQNGSGNVQNNTYEHRARPDPTSFSGLNPRTAADRILKLSYDDVVDLFASMAAQEASEIIAVLLTADEATVVAILGDLSPRKVTELGGVLVGSAKWLAVVPVAAEEISRKAAELAWPGADGLRRLNAGFYRTGVSRLCGC